MPNIVSFGLQYLIPNFLNYVKISGLNILNKLNISFGLPSMGVPDSNITLLLFISIGIKCIDLFESLDFK